MPLALDNAKLALYQMHQGGLFCGNYLECFCNLVDVVITYKGQLYNPGVLMMVFNNSSYDKKVGFGAQKCREEVFCDKALELQLAMMFIM
jgi:hypothetical protein